MSASRLAALCLLAAAPAFAQDGLYPQLNANVRVDLQFDRVNRRNGEPRTVNDLFPKVELATGLALNDTFGIQAIIKSEPVRELDRSRYVNDVGAWLEQIYARWAPSDAFAVHLGKFNPHFGTFFDEGYPGLYGDTFSEGYEIAEQWGLGVTWTFLSDPNFGEHDLTAEVFFADTSALSNSAFARPSFLDPRAERVKRNRSAYGGVTNTARPDNFVVALDGDSFAWLPGFAYHLSVASLGVGASTIAEAPTDPSRRETRIAATLSYLAQWSGDLSTLFAGEYVHIWNLDGSPRETIEDDGGAESVVRNQGRRHILTLGATTRWQDWSLALAGGWQRTTTTTDGRATDRFWQISVGRALGYGVSAQAGYAEIRTRGEEAERERIVGLKLTWEGALF